MKQRRKKRVLDTEKTLDKFEKRLRSMDPKIFEVFDGAYLSTFDIYSTIETDLPNYDRMCNSAFVIKRIAKEHGYSPIAITSERKSGGKYIAELLNGDRRETAKIVYVGRYNYFTKHEASIFRILPEDKVYF